MIAFGKLKQKSPAEKLIDKGEASQFDLTPLLLKG